MQQRVLRDGSSKDTDRAKSRAFSLLRNRNVQVLFCWWKGESGQKAIFDAKPKTRSRQAAKTTGCLEIEPMEHALFSFPLLLLRSADQVTVMI